MSKEIRWNAEKNELLKLQRGISFEMVVAKLKSGDILTVAKHPNREKYPNQSIFVMDIEGYTYYVPFVENDEAIFLKTIIPSRKLHKDYGEKA